MQEKKTPKLTLEYEGIFLSASHLLTLFFAGKFKASILKEEAPKQLIVAVKPKPQSSYPGRSTEALKKSLKPVEKKDAHIRFVGIYFSLIC